MNRVTLASLGLATGLLAASPALAQNGNTRSDPGQFLRQAIRGDMSEIQLGQLAADRSRSTEVRDFGRTLVRDHRKARREAQDLAHAMHITVPAEMLPQAGREYRKLQRLRGRAFDREFIDYMVMDHREDVRDFREQADAGNGRVSRLAGRQLPDLEKHLRIAEGLQRDRGVALNQGDDRLDRRDNR